MTCEIIERDMARDRDVFTAEAAQILTIACHGASLRAGWWNDLQTGEDMRGKRNVPELLCLIHSEISEAMEGHRKGLMDDKLPYRRMVEVELADAVIRIFDLAGGMGYDVAGAIADKLAFNAQRADHKPENRRAEGGKAY
jgi:NTP pyrophosphatase (non-canonical NTP hydrolase)